jgi:natural product biosynthesis luciferase-like monooxygenase protein
VTSLATAASTPAEAAAERNLAFGLIFFSSFEGTPTGDPYRLVLDSARFADANGFSSIWIPERHFTRDGWLYPNPAVLQAALARETTQIQLRAGSVVVPLHDPIRIVEEWAMVDNLSGGRVALSFASGWHPGDFVLAPHRYPVRHEEMYRGIETVRRLWEGGSIEREDGSGELVRVETYPKPLQRTLPAWITAAGNPQTFAKAGELGMNVLTHMFNHDLDELAAKLALYRETRALHGHDPAAGLVTVMLHTYVADEPRLVEEHAREAFCRYLRSAGYLLEAIGSSRDQPTDISALSEADVEGFVGFVYERLVSERRVLFGTPESCLELLAELQAIGVDEIACQLDFGLETEAVLASLPHLARLKDDCAAGRLDELAVARSLPLRLDPPAGDAASAPPETPEAIRARCEEEVAGSGFYELLRSRGVEFGDAFQGVERLWRRPGEALGRIRLPATVEDDAAAYAIHPALLDSCLQVLLAALPDPAESDGLYLPVGLGSFELCGKPRRELWSHAVVRPARAGGGSVEGDVRILDDDGELVAQATRVQLRQLEVAGGAAIDRLTYGLEWRRVSDGPAPELLRGGAETWLVLGDGGGVGCALQSALETAGATCILATGSSRFEVLDPRRVLVRQDSPDDLRRLLEHVASEDFPPWRGIVHLSSLDAPSVPATAEEALDAQAAGCGSALRLAQSLAHLSSPEPPRLWLVTSGAQAVAGEQETVAVAQAPLWGFGRALAYEHPNLWGGLVDLDPGAAAGEAAAQLAITIRAAGGEDELALRRGERYAPRLVRRPLEPRGSADALPADAAYLVSGGLGDLGLVVARWLATRGARHLILLGRTPLPPRDEWTAAPPGSRLAGQVGAIRELEALGVSVSTAAVDVADEPALAAFLRTCEADGGPPIRGVVHAAGTAQGSIVLNLDEAALEAVLRPKVAGGWALHRHFGRTELDFFLLFSAAPAVLGWLGQGAANYAAANAFLDALAEHRRRRGLPATSVGWGPWRQVGLVERTKGGLERLASQGVGSITPAQGEAVLDRLLEQAPA